MARGSILSSRAIRSAGQFAGQSAGARQLTITASEDRFGLALSTKMTTAAVADYIMAQPSTSMLSANAGGSRGTVRLRARRRPRVRARAYCQGAAPAGCGARIPRSEGVSRGGRRRTCYGRVNAREARHIEVIARAIEGDGPGAFALLQDQDPPSFRATRSSCRWRSACSAYWGSAAGSTITRRS